MGHEASGVVERVGAAVKDFRTGDRVTFDSTIYCGTCEFCRAGKINLCSNRRVLMVSCGEYRQDGAMAEYVAVPRHIVYKLPDAVSFEDAAFSETLSIGAHAVRLADLRGGQTAVSSVRKGGTVVLVGNISPSVPLPLQQVVTRELRLQGSCASAGEYPACIEMIEKKIAPVSKLISAIAPLAEGGAWFTKLRDKKTIWRR